MTEGASSEVTQLLVRLIGQGAFPGAVLLAATPERLVSARAGRLSVAADAPPVALGTRYDLASITKTFVSTASLLLREQGHLRLEDAAGRFLPGLPPDRAALTIRQLLAHTGGLAPGAAV
ncbi:MAG: serine hydrolase domain-containing protein, partial [Candidatus Dormibacteraceae bacterium]